MIQGNRLVKTSAFKRLKQILRLGIVFGFIGYILFVLIVLENTLLWLMFAGLILLGFFYLRYIIGMVLFGRLPQLGVAYMSFWLFFFRNDRDAYFWRSTLYLLAKQVDLAMVDVQKLKDLVRRNAPDFPASFFRLNLTPHLLSTLQMSVYILKRDYQAAITEVDEALALPDLPASQRAELQFKRAEAYLELGQAQDALTDIEALLGMEVESSADLQRGSQLMTHQSLALFQLNRRDDAMTAWRKALTAQPELADIAWLQENWKWNEKRLALAYELNRASQLPAPAYARWVSERYG
jgi:tetratricopeptide (TPR) repeat protein